MWEWLSDIPDSKWTIATHFIEADIYGTIGIAENGNFSCVDYYDRLASLVGNVDFHVNFDRARMRLNAEFLKNNQNAAERLCNFLIENPAGRFRLEGGHLQVFRGETWENWIQRIGEQWNIEQASTNGRIKSLVTQVNNCIRDGLFNPAQLDQIFNVVHNINDRANLRYTVFKMVMRKGIST